MLGWLVVMVLISIDPKTKQIDFNISTKIVKTEQECRYAGGLEEVRLRNDLGIDTSKYFSFDCMPLTEH